MAYESDSSLKFYLQEISKTPLLTVEQENELAERIKAGDEAARTQLVKFFEAWGPKDEFTLAGRRKLSSVLFS